MIDVTEDALKQPKTTSLSSVSDQHHASSSFPGNADTWRQTVQIVATNLRNLGLSPSAPIVFYPEHFQEIPPILLACRTLQTDTLLVMNGASSAVVHAWGKTRKAGLVIGGSKTVAELHLRHVAPAALMMPGQPGGPETNAASHTDPLPDKASVSVVGVGGIETISFDALFRSASQFRSAYPVSASDVILSTSSPYSLEGLCTALAIPLETSATIIHAEPGVIPTAEMIEHSRATILEMPADLLHQLAATSPGSVAGSHLRFLFCGSGHLATTAIPSLETRLSRRIYQGLGTARTGLWALARPYESASPELRPCAGAEAAIRPLRSPLHLDTPDPDAPTGEIVLRATAATPDTAKGEARTGLVGWQTPAGIALAGRLADIAVRAGTAFLVTDLDDRLRAHDGVRSSTTFLERGASPAERIVTVCEPALDPATVARWLDGGAHPLRPDSIITLPVLPARLARPDRVHRLRGIIGGTTAETTLAAASARRFRRSSPYDPARFRTFVDDALLRQAPLQFLMFWGCGPRRHAGPPETVALDALHDLLGAIGMASGLQTQVDIVFTDGHATNNGHSEAHYRSYFADVARGAAGLNVRTEFESSVWSRGGLDRPQIEALEREPGFEQRWQDFKLRDRFILQASRHSKMQDNVAAARHYYATCLLEREVLKRLFPASIFLTYNGPEFNECFPDLPTLYIYPGPRGPTDKPWFPHEGDGIAPQVAAE